MIIIISLIIINYLTKEAVEKKSETRINHSIL